MQNVSIHFVIDFLVYGELKEKKNSSKLLKNLETSGFTATNETTNYCLCQHRGIQKICLLFIIIEKVNPHKSVCCVKVNIFLMYSIFGMHWATHKI